MSEITPKDVDALYDNASPARRAILAQKIGLDIRSGDLSETEFHLAIEICRRLAEDVEVSVRTSLAEVIKSSTDIPKDLAVKLAQDVAEVSIPVLEISSLLDDQDLINIVRSGDMAKQIAITHRAEISAMVCHSLVNEGEAEVVESLLENQGAAIGEDSFSLMMVRFDGDEHIQKGMVERADLPIGIVDKLVNMISDRLKARLLTNHEVSPLVLEKVVLESKEDAKQRVLSQSVLKRDARVLASGLLKQGKLTPKLVTRSLEIGDRAFFEQSLSLLAGIPVENVRILVQDQGEKGFSALYRKAQLPKEDLEYVSFLVEAEYRSRRNQPRSALGQEHTTGGHDSWVTKTTAQKGRWRLI